ncbi:hypothetical protein [Streptomyces sp. NPDC006335]
MFDTPQQHRRSPDEATDTEGVRAVFAAERFDQLAAVKQRYDPGRP